MDSISQLSDDLLLRILSLTTTKDVLATSLLSKRWRYLWIFVQQLEYDDSDHIGDYNSFSQFVYRSFVSNKAPVLEYLRLNLGAECLFIDIGLWIDIAISRHVRELDIDIRSSNEGPVRLPSSLYTSETLENLTLVSFLLLDVPVNVCLPSLKSLSLTFVDYANDASLPRLLSGCPNLEELFVERYDGDITFNSTVVVPSLQRLTLWDMNSATCGGFVIDAPSLKYLHITDTVLYNFRQMENMPELVEARVCITRGGALEFLKALTSVQRLSLSLSLSEVMHPSGMNMIFNELVHLDLYTFTEGWWDLFTFMLPASPKLRFLRLTHKIENGRHSCKEIPFGWKPPSSVPGCLLFSLEAFEWIGYSGRQGDREMAVYVLKNAACLKTAAFSPESNDVGDKYQMLKELASVATASTWSQLLFD